MKVSAFVFGLLLPGSMMDSVRIEKYVDSLPMPETVRIEANRKRAELVVNLVPGKVKIHRDLPEIDTWTYEGKLHGLNLEIQKNQKLRIHWRNHLPNQHIFPPAKSIPGEALITQGLCGPNNIGLNGSSNVISDVRTTTHLHGAIVNQPSITDKIYNSDGWPDAWIKPGEEQIADYDNNQSARTLFFHDHAMTTTGRNVAAGLFGVYTIRDSFEKSLNLPSGKFEIPLVFQARGLNGDGSMYYTDDLAVEFYGNVATVNGALYPYLEVEPRKYRFRMINASNARSYAFKLIDVDSGNPGPEFVQIGSDSGFLPKPAVYNLSDDMNSQRLEMAPAERADVIIDFSKYEGKNLILINNSRDGAEGEIAVPELMMMKVGRTLSGPDDSQIPQQIAKIDRIPESYAEVTRNIVLSQKPMADGRMMQVLNGKEWRDPISERVRGGSTELWNLINNSPSAHPFHIHLVQFQVIDRRAYDVEEYNKTGNIVFTENAQPPEENEMGWKDTVKMPKGMITRIIMSFPKVKGYYIYHCHILEHEDMDMMRPFEVY